MEKQQVPENRIDQFRLPRCGELPELDLYMDQVISLMEKYLFVLSPDANSKFITPAMINNYVKLGVVPPPNKKRYSREHICYLFIICMLKSVVSIPSISQIITIQTKSRSIYELYDMFCEAYENVLNKVKETSHSIVDESEDKSGALAELSLFMAINASTAQLIAADALHALMPDEPSKEEE